MIVNFVSPIRSPVRSPLRGVFSIHKFARKGNPFQSPLRNFRQPRSFGSPIRKMRLV